MRDHKGTITDYNGKFLLNKVLYSDTIVCTYIGYERTIFIGEEFADYDTIYLLREAQLMDEVILLADDAVLYKLVSNSRKTNSSLISKAKTYFEMETFHDQSQLELFQGYYNGTYRGYDVSNLEMKNARFALAPISKRIFASTETSKAMYMQKLMNSNAYFPKSPFEMKMRELRNKYELSLTSIYKDQALNTIYVINFKPRKKINEYFQGTVWIDSLTNNLLKVKLKISNANIYPFQSIWIFHSLEKVNIEITKSFTSRDGDMFLKSIDFNYDLTYRTATDTNFNISTRAVLYAYNYEEEFTLPFFDFSESSNADYRQIQMLPYNYAFWECTDEFKVENNSNNRNQFLNELTTIKSYDLFSSDTLLGNKLFEDPYVTWNGNRILFREGINYNTGYNLTQGAIPMYRYHLEVQLFMDVNEICDSIQIITKTIFDPYLSYYKFTTTKVSQAFINIYFDLMEIERRKMHKELLECKSDIDLIKLKYMESKRQAAKISESYFKEVERGTNRDNLLKWNKVVLEELNIDNVSIFGIE